MRVPPLDISKPDSLASSSYSVDLKPLPSVYTWVLFLEYTVYSLIRLFKTVHLKLLLNLPTHITNHVA